MGASGAATVNAGAIGTQSSEVIVSVTGQAGILATSRLETWVEPRATTEHSEDEHRVENLVVHGYNIVAGTGFDIALRCENGALYGNWNVAWVWN